MQTSDIESRDIARGVEESLGLNQARGAAFVSLGSPGRGQAKTYRRQTGLDWLAGKGRLNAAQHAAGLRYGAIYRRVRGEGALRSSLNLQPEGGGGQPLASVLGQAEARLRANEALITLRRTLGQQSALVSACDLICGEELTPREATGNDREAGRMEAVLAVALDLLCANSARADVASRSEPGTLRR